MKKIIATFSLSFLGSFTFAGILQDPAAEKDTTKIDLPLLPERQFEITTSEGSWMSLDVSPDGQTIAFDFLGDLYTLPFSGGIATQLTEGMAFDSQPTFSPNGGKLVYTSDKRGGEAVWTIDLQSSREEQITSGKTDRYQSPEWSPDGEYIFVSKAGLRRGPLKIWMYHADGGTGVPLMKGQDPKTDDLKMTGAAFGPDGRYLWYGQRNRDWQYNAIFPQYQVGRYDRVTGKKETMSFRFGSGFRPTLSPDGQWLVYGTRFDGQTGLRLRNLKSGVEKWLAYPVQRDDQESRGTRDALPGMSFTPNSKEVVASYGGKIWRLPITTGAAIEIPFTISTKIDLGAQLDFDYPIPDSATFIVKQIRDGVPSPDGRWLAFTALDQLYVMDLQTRQPTRVTKHDFTEAQPTWSPDSEWLAYATWDAGQGKVYKTKVAGRRPGATVQLTSDNAIYEQPAWSPDGSKIVMLKGPATNYQFALNQSAHGTAREIVWVSAVDGGTTNFVDYSYGRRSPHFSNRSDRIFLFHSDHGLTSIRWDGTDEKNHLKVVGPKPPGFEDPIKASRILITPDEKGAIARVYNDMYWMAFPQVSDKAPSIDVSQGEKATFPVRKLSDIGGQFMAISRDGNNVYWSIGNALVIYDLKEGKRMADQHKSVAETFKEEGKKLSDDTLKYDPSEYRIKLNANRDLPKGTVVLKGATLITMKGDEIIQD
ncbi:MAG: TolB family protein, partial [Cyclobacteriaceae bacterium]